MKKLRNSQKILTPRLVLLICLILPAIILGQSSANGGLSPRDIAKLTLPSTVSIVMGNPRSKKLKAGSGFFVTEDVVATNYHVIENTTEGYVKVYGQDETFKITSVVGKDIKNDLALLRIEGIKGKPLSLNTGNTTAIGDTVFAVGNPKGLEGTFSQGIVSSMRTLGGHSLLQITAAISHGSSGGPILNESGEVVGVAVGAIESGQSLNFAIPVSLLRFLMPTETLTSTEVRNDYKDKPLAYKSLGFSFEIDSRISQSINYYRAEGRTTMESGLHRSGMYMRMARRIFKEEEVPENIAWLGQIESAWQASNSSGLWGLDERTAAKVGLQITSFVDKRKDFEGATRASARYLKFLANRYHGNWELAMAAYDLGEDKIDVAIRRAGVESFWLVYPYLPVGTRDFLPKVLATILIANSPNQTGFGTVRPAPSLTYDRVRVPESTNLSLVAKETDTTVENLRLLNPQLRKDITPPEPYIINVPAGKANELVKVFRSAMTPLGDKKDAKSSTGETWQTISDRTGVSVADLMDANPGMAKPKGNVFVPIEPCLIGNILVEAEKGDTVTTIAKRYGVDPDDVAIANGLSPTSLLVVGRSIKIPTKKCGVEPHPEQ